MAKRSKKNRGQTDSVSAREPAAKSAPIDAPTLLRALVIALAGLCVYGPALHGAWVWDDVELVTGNADLRSLAGLGKIWFAPPATDYWPLTWTLLWLEWGLWGIQPFGYHLVNLALHITSGLLLWRVLNRLGLRWGWLGGLLFVVHPLAVESVAWISEVKNALSLPFFLLAFDAWLDAEEGKPAGTWRALLYYLAAMLAKTSTVMLPVVLLLYMWWKRGRITLPEIKRLIPFFAIALVLGLVSIYFQNDKPEDLAIKMGGLPARLAEAGAAICFYLGKFIFPAGLLPIYPRASFDPPTPLQFLPLAALAGVAAGLWTQRRGWGRHALFALGFFVLNALPVLGLVKMEFLSISWVSDHLIYLPMLGLVGLAVAGLESGHARLAPPIRPAAVGAIAVALAFLAWTGRADAAHFANEETLWTYTLQLNPQASIAHNDLGTAQFRAGHVAEALDQFEQAVSIDPDYAFAHVNLGTALLQSGRPAQALEHYQQAVTINPNYPNAHNGLGITLLQAGRLPEAIEQYQLALKLNPDFANAHHNLADALMRTGQVPEAIAHYEQALALNPNFLEAHTNLANALMQTGRLPEAIAQYEQALKLRPNYPPARNGVAHAQALQASAPSGN